MKFIKMILIIILVISLVGLVACQDRKETKSTENNDVPLENENINEDNNDQQEENSEKDQDNNDNHSTNEENGNDLQEGNSEKGQKDNDDIITDKMMEDPSIITLVNKQYHLTEDDAPEDLVTLDVPTILENPEVNQLREVAANALKDMFDAAKVDDVYLYARSGFRSHQTQTHLFQSYAERNGIEAANKYSAKPGQSEHQTGLVMDVTSESVNYQLTESFGETKEGKWVQEHAHEYGFIIRYPKDAEDITGYIYEPWHIRYLGIDMATNVFNSGLTYEEFLEKEDIIDVVTK